MKRKSSQRLKDAHPGGSHRHQRSFLRLLRQGNLTLQQAMNAANVSRERLSRWLMGSDFARRVRTIIRRLKAIRTLEADFRSFIAESKLSEAVIASSPKPLDEAKLKKVNGQTVRPNRRRRRRVCKAAAPKSRPHPDVPPAQAEALAARLSACRANRAPQ
jgi:hypothetical protein